MSGVMRTGGQTRVLQVKPLSKPSKPVWDLKRKVLLALSKVQQPAWNDDSNETLLLRGVM